MKMFHSLGYLFLIFFSLASTHALAEPYLLAPGVVRYYNLTSTVGMAFIPEVKSQCIEAVVQDTTLNAQTYAQVAVQTRERVFPLDAEPEIVVRTETIYCRVVDSVLYQWTPTGDALLQDFSIHPGDSVASALPASLVDSLRLGAPIARYDTTVQFSSHHSFAVAWGDDPYVRYVGGDPPYEERSVLPGRSEWWATVFTDTLNGLPIPLGGGGDGSYSLWHPYYYVEGLGSMLTELNYRRMALVGVRLPSGQVYGQTFAITRTEPEPPEIPEQVTLYPAFPNPFNGTTQIRYDLSHPNGVTLAIYNLRGACVRQYVQKTTQPAGTYTVTFESTHLPSGVYFIRLQTKHTVYVSKAVLLK